MVTRMANDPLNNFQGNRGDDIVRGGEMEVRKEEERASEQLERIGQMVDVDKRSTRSKYKNPRQCSLDSITKKPRGKYEPTESQVSTDIEICYRQ